MKAAPMIHGLYVGCRADQSKGAGGVNNLFTLLKTWA